jgi:hypothetical protein
MSTGTSESGADGERGRELEQVEVALEQVEVALAELRRWPNRAQDLSPPELRNALAKLMGDLWHGVAPHGEGHLQRVIASVPDQSLDGGEPADDAGPGPDPPRGPRSSPESSSHPARSAPAPQQGGRCLRAGLPGRHPPSPVSGRARTGADAAPMLDRQARVRHHRQGR